MSLIAEIEKEVRTKIAARQGGVPTFFDNMLLGWIARAGAPRDEQTGSSEEVHQRAELLARIRDYAKLMSPERFRSYAERARESEFWNPLRWEPTVAQMNATQGVLECLQWRGVPLFKSAFDFAIYPMLISEARPATIIELGSGAGGSAMWFADLLRVHGCDGHVYSIDLEKPAVNDSLVTFIEGDCTAIEDVLPLASLDSLPHPWLVVEDVHRNTMGVLSHFATAMVKGDYMIVEDSRTKQADLAGFDSERGGDFRVDTRYTDFFGRNATSCADSIFSRI